MNIISNGAIIDGVNIGKYKKLGRISKFFYMTGTTRTITAILILIAMGIGGGRALKEIRAKTESVFYLGTEEYSFSIQDDIYQRTRLAQELTSIARRHLDSSHYLYNDIKYYSSVALNSTSYNQKCSTNAILSEQCRRLMNVLKNIVHVDDSVIDEFMVIRNQMAEIQGNINANSDIYNAKVEEYNNMLSSFPTNLASFVSGVKQLEQFKLPL